MESETMIRMITKSGSGLGVAMALLLGVSGCNSTNGAAGLDAGLTPAPQAATEVVKSSDLEGFCPQVVLREGTAVTTLYEKGGDGDANRVVYQGSISDVTRACTRGPDGVSITVGVAGKVVPGPKASGDPKSLPIRVAIVQGESVLYSELHQFQVTVVAGQPATQFVFSDPKPVVPLAGIKATQIFVGFDEGPPKQKKKTDVAG